MKGWLYYRLSRDDDKDMNSLKNQRKVLVEWCERNDVTIVGESYDDNVTGTTFERDGISEVLSAAMEHRMDVVVVKDFSRLGRHNAYTSLFIEKLANLGVSVFSTTENLSSANENDQLIIGIKHVLNQNYVDDLRRKILNGFRQKQLDGIVIVPSFGYVKDKYTKEININEECAEIVRLIFDLYNKGYGHKKILLYLNEHNYPSPSYYQKRHYNKNVPYNKTKFGKEYLWNDRTIGTILRNEAYIGTLVNRKTINNGRSKPKTILSEEQHIRHEGFFPPIISIDVWQQAQARIVHNKGTHARGTSTNQKNHRYAGLLLCSDCNSCFVAKRRTSQGFIEYVCNSYHRSGKLYCTPHRIREHQIDDLLLQELKRLKTIVLENCNTLDSYIRAWRKNTSSNIKEIDALSKKINEKRQEIRSIIRMSLKNPENEHLYHDMIDSCGKEIKMLEAQLERVRNSRQAAEQAKAQAMTSLEILEDVISHGRIDDGQIHLFVDKIYISELSDGKLHLKFILKGDFQAHRVAFEERTESYTEAKSA